MPPLSDEHLIAEVENHPILYNNKLLDFRDTVKRLKAWQDVGSIIGASAGKCEHRWRIFRQRYSKELAKLKRGPCNPSFEFKSWPYMKQMSFLEPFIIPRKHQPRDHVFFDGKPSQSCSPPPETAMHFKFPVAETDEELLEETFESGTEDISDGQTLNRIDSVAVKLEITDTDDHQLNNVRHVPLEKTSKADSPEKDLSKLIKKTLEVVKTPRDFSFNDSQLFCLSVAERIQKLEPRDRAIARMRIEKILIDIEFGCDCD